MLLFIKIMKNSRDLQGIQSDSRCKRAESNTGRVQGNGSLSTGEEAFQCLNS